MIFNERGSSLMSTVLAVGVSVFVILGMAASVSLLHSGAKSVQLSSEQLRILDDIRMAVEKPVSCSSNLQGQTLGLVSQNASTLSSITVRIGGEDRVLSAGSEIVPGLVLRSMGLFANRAVEPQDIKLPVNGVLVDYQKRVALLTIETEKTGNVIAQKSQPVTIPINVITDASGTIKECHGPATFNASSCNDLGLVPIPDATLPTGFRCLPKDTCRKGGVYGTGPIGQGGFVNPMTGAQSCPTGYIPKRAGAVTFTGDCGKTCLSRKTYPTYQCLACLDQDGQPLAMLPDPDTGVQDTTLDFSQEMDEADAAFDAQATSLDSLTSSVTSPTSGYTCNPSGTVILDQPCTAGPMQNVNPYSLCCSNSASICTITMDVMDVGPVTVPERIVCN